MHGCPADEIESIANYLLKEKKLHTYVKLNPTLLGAEQLRNILNDKLNFKAVVPDQAFEHDLKYDDALNIIRNLQKIADTEKLEFGLKLTNTLESNNIKEVFDSEVDMMYLSGRALHPISINMVYKLQKEFDGKLNVSFSGGADAFNVADILSCGLKPITVSSDLLKPGGYTRLYQYFENLQKTMQEFKSDTISTLIDSVCSVSKDDTKKSALENLSTYANEVLENNRYKRQYIQEPNIKTNRDLDYFDCISAPCKDTCATNQDIPDYMYYTANQQFDKAYETILNTNPFPAITGMVCDHLCQNKCTRVNYDSSLLIREVKRFISEQDEVKLKAKPKNGLKAAIIGAGPSGLSAAYYLALAGFTVTIYEAKNKAGGMVKWAIPGFRLTNEAIEKDFKRITDLGVEINYNSIIDGEGFNKLRKDNTYIYIAVGAQTASSISIDNADAKGVLNPLHFLFNVKKSEPTDIGKNVVIIGGGNTAMDSARTAYRLVGKEGNVTVVYRRTINEMPADQQEIMAVVEENVQIIELTSPESIVVENDRVVGLKCAKMKLGKKDVSGRRSPIKIEGSEFIIPCDTIIPAIGQKIDIPFIQEELLTATTKNYKTKLTNIFIGGDALRGASTAINAIGDGRKVSEQIIEQAKVDFKLEKPLKEKNISKKELMLKRAYREYPTKLKELDLSDRKNFKLVTETLSKEEIVAEAQRCLYCDEICNICTTVCPNFANYSYEITPVKYELQKVIREDNGDTKILPDIIFEVKQKYQILNIGNFCNECGNCSTFCPTNRAPYQEKPKFFLTIEAFNEAEEGYYLVKLKDKINLIYKLKGEIKTLSELANEYEYETDHVKARFNKADFKIIDVKCKTPCVRQVQFQVAAEMSVLLQGAKVLYT